MQYTTSFIVFPEHCNHLKELIFGGAFMAQMDLSAAHCVRRLLFDADEGVEHAVTHKASFEFHKPAYVGDLLELEADIQSVGEKSIVVEVVAWRNKRRNRTKIATGDFVFISVGDVGDLSAHPEFLPYKKHGLTDADIQK
jgi:acyl-CoA hydrolase